MIITFRKARPEDVDIVIPLIYSSGPAAFEYVFKVSEKKDAQAFLKYAFVRPGSEFSYTNHTCVVLNHKEIIGIGASFSSDTTMKFTTSAIKFMLAFYGIWEGIKAIKRGMNIEKIIPPPKGNTEVIAHLGINPELRGKGFGAKLIDYFIEKAGKKGRATVSLDVSIENPKAKALYERLGFQIKKEHKSNFKNKHSYVAHHYKMIKEI